MAPDGAFRVYCTHLDHVDEAERLMQIGHLRERIDAYPREGGAITGAADFGFPEPPCPEDFVLMGDLNLMRGSPEHRALTGGDASSPVDVYDLAGGVPEDAVSFVGADEEHS